MLACSRTATSDLGVSHGNSNVDAGEANSTVATADASFVSVTAPLSASLVPAAASAADSAQATSGGGTSPAQTLAVPAPSASGTSFLVVPLGVSDAVAAGLQPLWTPGATIEQATGEDLIELALDVGLARGFANCLCNGDQAKTPEFFKSCAPGESWLYSWVDAASQKKCLAEGLNELPGLDDFLRCQSYWVQNGGFYDLAKCLGEDAVREAAARPATECEPLPGVREFVQACSSSAYYCADGTRAGRCDEQVDCEDRADELNCFEVNGHDMVDCRDHLIQNVSLCWQSSQSCFLADGTAVCNLETRQFRCKDGVEISTDAVCDRKQDCADGTDEQLCLR